MQENVPPTGCFVSAGEHKGDKSSPKTFICGKIGSITLWLGIGAVSELVWILVFALLMISLCPLVQFQPGRVISPQWH